MFEYPGDCWNNVGDKYVIHQPDSILSELSICRWIAGRRRSPSWFADIPELVYNCIEPRWHIEETNMFDGEHSSDISDGSRE